MKELIQELKRSDINILFIIHNKSDYYTFNSLNEILISEGINTTCYYHNDFFSPSSVELAYYVFRIKNGNIELIKCRTEFNYPIIDLKNSIREYKINKILND